MKGLDEIDGIKGRVDEIEGTLEEHRNEIDDLDGRVGELE